MHRIHTMSVMVLSALQCCAFTPRTSAAEPAPASVYIPYDVRDAVIALGELLGPEWGKLTPEEMQMSTRPALMQVRNLWLYGSDKSPRLKNYFHRKGIYNAELMSAIIWDAYLATINQTHFKLREAITQMASYPTGVNLFTPEETHVRPPETLHLWRAYLVQKDDQTAIQVFCDESGTLLWTYDPDEGWSTVSKHILNVVRTDRAIRLIMGMGDDGQIPLGKAIQRIRNPLPGPEDGLNPFAPR